jgi:hypothetical protein
MEISSTAISEIPFRMRNFAAFQAAKTLEEYQSSARSACHEDIA